MWETKNKTASPLSHPKANGLVVESFFCVIVEIASFSALKAKS